MFILRGKWSIPCVEKLKDRSSLEHGTVYCAIALQKGYRFKPEKYIQ